jgi:hypothetical protein
MWTREVFHYLYLPAFITMALVVEHHLLTKLQKVKQFRIIIVKDTVDNLYISFVYNNTYYNNIEQYSSAWDPNPLFYTY